MKHKKPYHFERVFVKLKGLDLHGLCESFALPAENRFTILKIQFPLWYEFSAFS